VVEIPLFLWEIYVTILIINYIIYKKCNKEKKFWNWFFLANINSIKILECTHFCWLLFATGIGVGTLGGGTGIAFLRPPLVGCTVGVTLPVGAIRPAVRGLSVRISIIYIYKKWNKIYGYFQENIFLLYNI